MVGSWDGKSFPSKRMLMRYFQVHKLELIGKMNLEEVVIHGHKGLNSYSSSSLAADPILPNALRNVDSFPLTNSLY